MQKSLWRQWATIGITGIGSKLNQGSVARLVNAAYCYLYIIHLINDED